MTSGGGEGRTNWEPVTLIRIGLQQIQKSPHPNSHPLKNKCRALAVWHFFLI